eukprot:TRINITY_DN109707_c0_g1_i1.p1 TRINITY_DN109707_c0_g1~~TRINITY_DN109707_c0_g1_i1.p1  ORF type:complete len:720 (-),score=124.06 TRINITY_DN109707_c0_g1_i1:100-1935(-)
MLQRVSAKFGPLPDAEFVVDTSDGYAQIEAPLFVISKFPSAAGGILYPDFSSFAWPESECPSERPGTHVWSRVAADIRSKEAAWTTKSDQLFWRGAATSVYRQQVVPHVAELTNANVSLMEWVVGAEGQRQLVRSGDESCVPVAEWCRHKFLANLPGNTMALALKYRLLCGSVIVSSPLMYHEWYYSQLVDGEHYVKVDLYWSSAEDVLRDLRGPSQATAEAIANTSREWARLHLNDDGFDCYWLRLIQLASQHFPAPQLNSDALPLESAMFASLGAGVVGRGAVDVQERPQLDALIVIPARASDIALIEHARKTWLQESSPLNFRHFFVIAGGDPDRDAIEAEGWMEQDDILVVDCEHGYTRLLQKMASAFRVLLVRFDVAFFIRADVDSVLPLRFFFDLLPFAAKGQAVIRLPGISNCGDSSTVRWKMRSIGQLACQTECATDRGCNFYSLTLQGDCMTFAECSMPSSQGQGEVFEYRLRTALRQSHSREIATDSQDRPFILGTILHGNKVFINDTHNPQWNNPKYSHDLGISVYPPYPEASGYAMSASVAAFLAGVGQDALSSLSWKAWAIEDAALGTILAGLDVDMLQLPREVREHIRVIRVPKRTN